jgi:hypothetical protein
VVAPRFANDEEDGFIEEAGRIRKTTLSITHLRQRNIEDKAAGQCRCDLAVYVDGSRLIVDVAVADATAPSYRRPSPRHPPPPDESPPQAFAGRDAAAAVTTTPEANTTPPPPLPGQSFAIEHLVLAKMTKFRPLLGAAVNDPKRFMPFVLEASGRLGPEAEASLLGVPTVHLLFPDITFPRPRVRALRET